MYLMGPSMLALYVWELQFYVDVTKLEIWCLRRHKIYASWTCTEHLYFTNSQKFYLTSAIFGQAFLQRFLSPNGIID
ncbi:hypothetical protein V2J09_010028 [Rumex salicifolius]